MANSIEPRVNYTAGLTPQATLNGTIGTIVYASNYNDLDNKPQINNVELRGNKTAHDLGLATPEDITVTSVNNQTGDVELSGSNLNYDSTYTINNKIDDLQSQISSSGVLSVNGKIGVVTLDGTDINYSAGVTLNQKINAVEAEIPTVDYPVTSVNNKTGAVVLDATDIEYSSGTSIKTQIDTVAGDIPTTYVESINGDSGAVTLTGADLTLGTSADPSTIAGAVMGVQTISASAGSAVTTGDYYLACYQVGKVVQVYIVGSANSAWSGTSQIITGLPKPKDTAIRYTVLKTSAGTPYELGTSYQVAINASGVLTPMYIPSGAIGSGDYFVISFTYIAE